MTTLPSSLQLATSLLVLGASLAACSSGAGPGLGDNLPGVDVPGDTTGSGDVTEPPDADRTDTASFADGGTDPGAPLGSCTRSADCVAAERCASCDTASCTGCPGCASTCVPHPCSSEDTLVCAMLRPDCIGEAVSVIRNGCWVCVDLTACTASGDDPGGSDVADPGVESVEPADVPSDPGQTVEGTWVDPATGLRWQQPPTDSKFVESAAKTYCNDLALGGFTDWRLPRIDELRGLIRGCPATETGGACGVTNSCTKAACKSAACDGCTEGQGPNGSCYWAPELTGNCRWYWSGDDVQDATTMTWAVVYEGGYIIQAAKMPVIGANNVRCVR